MADFRTQFPDFLETDYPALPEGFDDSSWCNDGQPSMQSYGLGLFVVVDWLDPMQRNHDDETAPRFSVYNLHAGAGLDDDSFLDTDCWDEVLAAVETRRASLSPRAILENEWKAFLPSSGDYAECDALEWSMSPPTDATPAQHEFVRAFIDRWQAMEAAEDATREG